MYEKALGLDPQHANTVSNYAQLLIDMNNASASALADAEQMFLTVLRCSCRPSVPDVHQVAI